eukprot:CAMPEP_0119118450 /NCGR_PEP_ID=MMETSP1310-20130426/325_1 /TAXON_ID=464262 /ORGANISM="Genus nov. species nov., Strain RCC2339" /LENGTH=142 /DNA_ID=CAMNT_0007107817 /DNA_START=77 /DNA_END=505 /DNA_ORIENTATION=+
MLTVALGHNVVGTINNISNVTWVLVNFDLQNGRLISSPDLLLAPFASTIFEAEDVRGTKYIKAAWIYNATDSNGQPTTYCAPGTPSPPMEGYFRWHYGDEKCEANTPVSCANPPSTTLKVEIGGCGTAVGTSKPIYTASVIY